MIVGSRLSCLAPGNSKDRKWAVEKAALQTGSNTNNTAIPAWAALLPSWTDARITGEFIGLLSVAAACSMHGNLTGVRWLRDYGHQFTSRTIWIAEIDDDDCFYYFQK